MQKENLKEDIRVFLANELTRRRGTNGQYSLRAFAKQLAVDPSYLSKVLNGKRAFSEKAIADMHERIEFSDSISATVKQLTKKKMFNSLNLEKFRIISDWHHFALLEMTKLKSFRQDPTWIANYLNISTLEAAAIISRLKRCSLIKVDCHGKWIVQDNTTIKHRQSDIALRKMQMQILNQAMLALENVPMEQRDQSSIAMCVDEKRLEEAKLRIKNFRRSLMEFLEGGDSKDSVYQLSISLFPLEAKKYKGVDKIYESRN